MTGPVPRLWIPYRQGVVLTPLIVHRRNRNTIYDVRGGVSDQDGKSSPVGDILQHCTWTIESILLL